MEPPYCSEERADCGSPVIALFVFLSYYIGVTFILINVFVGKCSLINPWRMRRRVMVVVLCVCVCVCVCVAAIYLVCESKVRCYKVPYGVSNA